MSAKSVFPIREVGLIAKACAECRVRFPYMAAELVLHTGLPFSTLKKLKQEQLDLQRNCLILSEFPDRWLLPLSSHGWTIVQTTFRADGWQYLKEAKAARVEEYDRTVTEIEEFELATLPRVFELGMKHVGTPNKLIAAATKSPNRRGYRIPSQEELDELRDYMNRWSSLVLELGKNATLPERFCLEFD